MSHPRIAKLSSVGLRKAWTNEAQDFTPWLHENLDALGDAVGMRLEQDSTEVRVESFAADILARNSEDGSKVLIENQLESSDHKHLGQILTYLAGLEANTVIWVAAAFHDAHLSAINWLNENTSEAFAFFAVRVKVVQILDSPFAPIFDVIARPNTWERRLKSGVRTERSELSQKRYEFWTRFVDLVPGELERSGDAGFKPNRWREITVPEGAISMYLNSKSVGLFVRSRRGESQPEFRELLQTKRDEIESRINVPIGDTDWYFFEDHTDGDFSDPAERDLLIRWLASRADEYESALKEVFG